MGRKWRYGELIIKGSYSDINRHFFDTVWKFNIELA